MDQGEATGLDRRQFLLRGAAAAGGLSAISLAPGVAREAYGAPIPVPGEARSVEAGLTAFTARWQGVSAVVAVTRFGQFVSNKIFNCRVADQPRSWTLRLGVGTGTLTPGIDPFRHADMIMAEEDWLGLLYGDFTGLAPFMDGTVYPERDGSNKVALLGILMHTFAHFPAGSNPPDPDLLTHVLTSLARHGLPECEGQLDILDEAERMLGNPEQELHDTATPSVAAPPLTRTLAEFTHGLSYEDLPSGTIQSAKEQLVAILGAMYAGSRMPPARKFARAIRGFGEPGEATVIGAKPFSTSVRHAALLNSVHAQVLEWEDWTFIVHSGASIIPTALAAGELAGASGKEVIAAIVAGNEILARAGEVLTDVLHTGNAVAVHQIETPLVAGKLLGLDAEGLQDAVGISCVQPQSTSIPAWTADAKGLLSGWPVLTGIEAAQYALAGVSGRRDILESPAGYCYRVADIASPRRLERLVEGLGEVWRFDREANELFTKRYPTDGFQLTSVQGIIDIVDNQAADVFGSTPREELPNLVERVTVRIPWVMAATATMFNKGRKEIYERIRDRPDWTYISLLFDGYYPLAAALVNRRLTFHEYDESVIFDPVVQAIIDKVELVPDLSMGVFGAEAHVVLADGREYRSRQDCIEDFAVREKIEIGAKGILPRRKRQAIVRAAYRLERFTDVGEFVRIAAGG